MNTWTTPAHQLRAAQARILADILLELDTTTPTTLKQSLASPAGSEHKLRGIPVVGAQGVSGTQPGTNPPQALLTKERWRNVH